MSVSINASIFPNLVQPDGKAANRTAIRLWTISAPNSIPTGGIRRNSIRLCRAVAGAAGACSCGWSAATTQHLVISSGTRLRGAADTARPARAARNRPRILGRTGTLQALAPEVPRAW